MNGTARYFVTILWLMMANVLQNGNYGVLWFYCGCKKRVVSFPWMFRTTLDVNAVRQRWFNFGHNQRSGYGHLTISVKTQSAVV